MNVINSNSVMAMRAAILQQNSALREAASAASAPASPVSGASAPASTRSEEHTSELQSLMRISYAVFCLKKKKNTNTTRMNQHNQAQARVNTMDATHK